MPDIKNVPSVVALIPARSGSQRVKDKNIRPLAGHPLIAFTISAALQSGVFKDVIVSTDSEQYAAIARHYGAEIPFLRPGEIAGSASPDIEWVEDTLTKLRRIGRTYDCFSILRPTSPFRQADTICRAWNEFTSHASVDSLRAVEKVKQHPGKMWVVRGKMMYPLLPISPAEQPWHSSQTNTLPDVYVQNASLEIARTRVIFDGRTIAGWVIMPFFTQGYEGFDVNLPYDWEMAKRLIASGEAALPKVEKTTYPLPV